MSFENNKPALVCKFYISIFICKGLKVLKKQKRQICKWHL